MLSLTLGDVSSHLMLVARHLLVHVVEHNIHCGFVFKAQTQLLDALVA